MLKVLFPLVLSGGLVTAAQAQQSTQPQAHQLSESERSELRVKLAVQLLDPNAAEIEKVSAVKYDDGIVSVCGVVPVQGGPTGFKLFMGDLHNPRRTAFLISDIDKGVEADLAFCQILIESR